MVYLAVGSTYQCPPRCWPRKAIIVVYRGLAIIDFTIWHPCIVRIVVVPYIVDVLMMVCIFLARACLFIIRGCCVRVCAQPLLPCRPLCYFWRVFPLYQCLQVVGVAVATLGVAIESMACTFSGRSWLA